MPNNKDTLIEDIIKLLSKENTKLLKEDEYLSEGFSLSTYIIPQNIFINVMNYNIKIYSIIINIPTTQGLMFGISPQLDIIYYSYSNTNRLNFDLLIFMNEISNSFSILDLFYIKTLLLNNMI